MITCPKNTNSEINIETVTPRSETNIFKTNKKTHKIVQIGYVTGGKIKREKNEIKVYKEYELIPNGTLWYGQ